MTLAKRDRAGIARVCAHVLAVLFGCALVLAQISAAAAHASLIASEPSDNAVVAESPQSLTLTFNEPVAPLILRLVGPDGQTQALTDFSSADGTVRIAPPAPLAEGTHVLSWRVISADGHPVGGALVFSVGRPSARAAAPELQTERAVLMSLWAAKFVLYLGLFVGIGGAVFIAWLGRAGSSLITVALVAGFAAALLSIGLQGLDALVMPLSGLWRPAPWVSGLATSYGKTATAAALAMAVAFASLRMHAGAAKSLSLLALAGAALSLTLSGHAGTAPPQWLTRPAVFLHAACVGLWIGALIPLAGMLRARQTKASVVLMRFTRMIPVVIAVLAASGICLAIVQLDHFDALWTTNYGIVLSCKLIAVGLVLALASLNRFVLTRRFQRDAAKARGPLLLSIAAEAALVLIIFGLVAGWRFTPPPRAFVPPPPILVHLHGERAIVNIDVALSRSGRRDATITITDAHEKPLGEREVTVTLSKPEAGIEGIRRNAEGVEAGTWRISDLRLPIGGVWRIRIDILVSDFDRITLESGVELGR